MGGRTAFLSPNDTPPLLIETQEELVEVVSYVRGLGTKRSTQIFS